MRTLATWAAAAVAVVAMFSVVFGFGNGSISLANLRASGLFNIKKSERHDLDLAAGNVTMGIYDDAVFFRNSDAVLEVEGGGSFHLGPTWLTLDNLKPKVTNAKVGAGSAQAQDSVESFLLDQVTPALTAPGGPLDGDVFENVTKVGASGKLKADRSFSEATGGFKLKWGGVVDRGPDAGRKFSLTLNLQVDADIGGPTPPPRPQFAPYTIGRADAIGAPFTIDVYRGTGGVPRIVTADANARTLRLYEFPDSGATLLENVTVEFTPRSSYFSPDGNFVSVLFDQSPSISIYNHSGNSLSPWGSPIPIGSLPPTGLAWSADSRHLVVTAGRFGVSSGAVQTYEINPPSSATPLTLRSTRSVPFTSGLTLTDANFAILPHGNFGSVLQLENVTGMLNFRSTFTLPFVPFGVTDDGASSVYFGEQSGTGASGQSRLHRYTLNTSSGAMSPSGSVALPGLLTGLDYGGPGLVATTNLPFDVRYLTFLDDGLVALTGRSYVGHGLENVTVSAYADGTRFYGGFADQSAGRIRVFERRPFGR